MDLSWIRIDIYTLRLISMAHQLMIEMYLASYKPALTQAISSVLITRLLGDQMDLIVLSDGIFHAGDALVLLYFGTIYSTYI